MQHKTTWNEYELRIEFNKSFQRIYKLVPTLCQNSVCTKQSHTKQSNTKQSRKVWKWTKKQSNTKQSEKQSQIIVLTSRQAENCPLFNKPNEKNSDSRSRANMLRACQQRVGIKTKFRAGY